MSTDATTSVTTTTPLPDDLSICQEMIRELLHTLHARDREVEQLRHRLDHLLRRLYGLRAERVDQSQLLLFAQQIMEQTPPPPAEAAEAVAASAPPPSKNGHGRKKQAQ